VKISLPNSDKLEENVEIVRKYYLKLLRREPDTFGLCHFSNLMDRSEINEDKLIKIIKKSDEYRRIKSAEVHDRRSTYTFKGLYNIKYLIRPNSVLDNIVVKNGVFDKWICLKLGGLIHKDATVLDIGANAGLLTLPFAKVYVPDGLVYAFEPVSHIVNHLKTNIKLNQSLEDKVGDLFLRKLSKILTAFRRWQNKFSNIIVEQKALQDNPRVNRITLNLRQAIHDNGLRNDGLSTIEKNLDFKIGEEVVKTSTVDRYVSEKNIYKLELIKIDTEGSEYRILKGGKETIKKFLPIIIYEYSPTIDKLVSFENSKRAYKFMKKMGYKQYRLIRNILIEMEDYNSKFADCNIVCFHKSKFPP